MIIVLKQDANPEKVQKLKEKMEKRGFVIQDIKGETTTMIGLAGDTTRLTPEAFLSLDFVKTIIKVQEPYKLVGRRFHRYGDMQKTMKNAPVADVNILMSHDPTHWEAEIIESYPQFDITLSGHTHGMQIGFEGLGLKWSPSQYIYKNWGGLYKRKSSRGIESRLYVNLGLGHIAYPGRVGILPEITLITLTRKN